MTNFKTVTAHTDLSQCYSRLVELGCKNPNNYTKTFKNKGLLVFRNNLVILDEYNLLN